MLKPWFFVGFTGHRNIASPALVTAGIGRAFDRLQSCCSPRLAAVSSVASGADALFAEAALARQFPWLLLLPFPVAEFRRDFTEATWARSEALIPRAVSIHIHPTYREATALPPDARNAAFAECGYRTVDECDVLMTVWDGLPGRGPGGTAEIVAYARQLGRPIVWIHSETGELKEENFENLSYYPVSKTSHHQEPSPEKSSGREELQATLQHFDSIAIKHAPESRELVTRVIFLHLAATVIAICGPFFFGKFTVVLFVLILLKVAALLYAQRLHHLHRHSHGSWLENRILAELCRSALATWPLKFSENIHRNLPFPGFRGWQHSLRLSRLLNPPPESTVAEMKRGYLEHRVADQLAYYERALSQARSRLEALNRWASRLTWFAIACGVVLLGVMALHGFPEHHAWWESPVKFLSVVLPLASAALLHWALAHDYGRRVVRNREMVKTLMSAKARIAVTTSWEYFEPLVRETETLLLLEVLEWHSVSRFSGEAH